MLTQKDLEREVREISNFLRVSHGKDFSVVFCTLKDKTLSFAIMILAKTRLNELGFVFLNQDEVLDKEIEEWLKNGEILYFVVR